MASAGVDHGLLERPVGPLRHRCAQCASTGPTLIRCSGCHAVRYCSHEHQAAHQPKHESSCTNVRNVRALFAEQERLDRERMPDAFDPHASRSWEIGITQDYYDSRHSLAHNKLFELGTRDGIQEALDHTLALLTLCQCDVLALRTMVPRTMLRLNLDQECYDFVKWWATDDPDDSDEGMTKPYFTVQGADFLEDPSPLIGGPAAVYRIVPLTLLRLKLLVDIRNLKIARKISARRHLPAELWNQVELLAIQSPLSFKLQQEPHESLLKIETRIIMQLRLLGQALVKCKPKLMFKLLKANQVLAAGHHSDSRLSKEDWTAAKRWLWYPEWWETEGVLDLLSDARACAARDSEDEIQDLKKQAGDFCPDRNYAVENAAYLGPWSERPSERHTRERKEKGAGPRSEGHNWLAEEADGEEEGYTDEEYTDDEENTDDDGYRNEEYENDEADWIDV